MTGPLELEPGDPEPRRAGPVRPTHADEPPDATGGDSSGSAPLEMEPAGSPPPATPDATLGATLGATNGASPDATPGTEPVAEAPASEPQPTVESAAPAVAAPSAPAPADPGAPSESPWLEILRTPVAPGVLPATFMLAALFLFMSWVEGGSTKDSRHYLMWLRGALWIPAFAVLGLWSRRITKATIEDRPVAGFTDELDPMDRRTAAGLFVVCLAVGMLPAGLWMSVQSAFGAPSWLTAAVLAACLVAATLHLPFAHAATVLRDDASGALPTRSLRAWRKNAFAAKIAVAPTAAFLGLFGIAAVLSGTFNPSPERGATIEDHTFGRDLLRFVLFGVRFAMAWAALVAARVSGMLVRDVPEVRQEIQ
ncbi:MAG: hypothetical protein HMLKMBBP_00163 [Planctomycetes bacterium]|nr:hypothetical protein [Planctomycetota bacterium]